MEMLDCAILIGAMIMHKCVLKRLRQRSTVPTNGKFN